LLDPSSQAAPHPATQHSVALDPLARLLQYCIPPRHLRSPLLPYTTLFRSRCQEPAARVRAPGSAGGVSLGLAAPALEGERGEARSAEHTSELQSLAYLVFRVPLVK